MYEVQYTVPRIQEDIQGGTLLQQTVNTLDLDFKKFQIYFSLTFIVFEEIDLLH